MGAPNFYRSGNLSKIYVWTDDFFLSHHIWEGEVEYIKDSLKSIAWEFDASYYPKTIYRDKGNYGYPIIAELGTYEMLFTFYGEPFELNISLFVRGGYTSGGNFDIEHELWYRGDTYTIDNLENLLTDMQYYAGNPIANLMTLRKLEQKISNAISKATLSIERLMDKIAPMKLKSVCRSAGFELYEEIK